MKNGLRYIRRVIRRYGQRQGNNTVTTLGARTVDSKVLACSRFREVLRLNGEAMAIVIIARTDCSRKRIRDRAERNGNSTKVTVIDIQELLPIAVGVAVAEDDCISTVLQAVQHVIKRTDECLVGSNMDGLYLTLFFHEVALVVRQADVSVESCTGIADGIIEFGVLTRCALRTVNADIVCQSYMVRRIIKFEHQRVIARRCEECPLVSSMRTVTEFQLVLRLQKEVCVKSLLQRGTECLVPADNHRVRQLVLSFAEITLINTCGNLSFERTTGIFHRERNRNTRLGHHIPIRACGEGYLLCQGQ